MFLPTIGDQRYAHPVHCLTQCLKQAPPQGPPFLSIDGRFVAKSAVIETIPQAAQRLCLPHVSTHGTPDK
eukprot:6481727-Amphidinium_carterae.1